VPALLVGTRKGLFVLSSDEDRRDWEVSDPLLTGWEVFHAVPDPRDGSVYAATNSFVYGATVHGSEDRGETWTRAEELGLGGKALFTGFISDDDRNRLFRVADVAAVAIDHRQAAITEGRDVKTVAARGRRQRADAAR